MLYYFANIKLRAVDKEILFSDLESLALILFYSMSNSLICLCLVCLSEDMILLKLGILCKI